MEKVWAHTLSFEADTILTKYGAGCLWFRGEKFYLLYYRDTTFRGRCYNIYECTSWVKKFLEK